MNSNMKSYFTDMSSYAEEYKGMSEYDSTEFWNMEHMLDILWPGASYMKRWKTDILYHYVCSKGQQAHSLPPVSLYNYML